MKRILLIFLLNIVLQLAICQNIKIYGYVSDLSTKERIIGAIVNIDNNVVSTNEFGFYSLTVDKNTQNASIQCRYIGFEKYQIAIELTDNKRIDIELKPSNEISNIIVKGTKQNLQNFSISDVQVKKLPSLVGEKDILKSIQLMPGVQFGNEGTSDLYVRGGTPEQNLILVDDIPVYYIGHLGSFISIFDINSINKVKLYKSGFPAKYSGFLSSILDVRLKDGNQKKMEGEFSIGIVSSKLSLNGPIIKDKLSFVLTIRECNLSLIEAIYNRFQKNNYKIPVYNFYDFNSKINYNLSKFDKIDISFYKGQDRNILKINDFDGFMYFSNVKADETMNNSWGNNIVSARWTHIYSSSLFQKIIIGYTSFKYKNTVEEIIKLVELDSITIGSTNNFEYNSQIQDIIAKLDYDYQLNSNNKINFGLNFVSHFYQPASISAMSSSNSTTQLTYNFEQNRQNTQEMNLYVDYNFYSNIINAFVGLNYNLYYNQNFWQQIQPHIALVLFPAKKVSINLTYDKNYQNFHLLTQTNSAIPSDMRVPATKVAVPQKANQFALSFNLLFNKKISFTAGTFYKYIQNTIDFRVFASDEDTSFSIDWEKNILKNGVGKAYGAEFLLQLDFEKFSSWVSYTYMYNTRQYEGFNKSKPFAANFDRRHNLQIVLDYSLSKKFSVSSIFMFGSGYPFNLPVIQQNIVELIENRSHFQSVPSIIILDNSYYATGTLFSNKVFINQEYNKYRMPDYHRLDICFNWSKFSKKAIHTFTLNFYNVYNRTNALFLYFKKDINNQIKLYKYSLFPIIPSFSWSYKF
mgnify:CR=1 FL=1